MASGIHLGNNPTAAHVCSERLVVHKGLRQHPIRGWVVRRNRGRRAPHYTLLGRELPNNVLRINVAALGAVALVEKVAATYQNAEVVRAAVACAIRTNPWSADAKDVQIRPPREFLELVEARGGVSYVCKALLDALEDRRRRRQLDSVSVEALVEESGAQRYWPVEASMKDAQ